MLPTVSICIAAYNVEKYLSECVESIIRFESDILKEIIIIDDLSTDATPTVIESLMHQYPEERIISSRNTKNLGPGGSYNLAANIAHGEYITFLDSDDFLIAPGLAEKLDIFARESDMQMIYGDGSFLEQGRLWLTIQPHLARLFSHTLEYIKKELYTTIPMMSVSSCLMRKDFFDAIGWFDPDCRSNDWVLNLRIFSKLTSKSQFSYISTPVFAYRIHAQNISKDQVRMRDLLAEVVDKYIPPEYKNLEYGNIYFFTSLNFILQWEYRKSYRNFLQSLRFDFRPMRIIIYIVALMSPVRYIADRHPKLFMSIKKTIQKFFS